MQIILYKRLMLEGKVKRGTYGYINARKKSLLIKTLFFAIIIIALIIIGLLVFGYFKNGLLIPSMILVAPFANFFASYMAVVRFKTPPADMYSKLRHYDDAGMLLSDNIIVDEKGKRYLVEFIVFHDNGIIGYSKSVISEKYIPESHINNTLSGRGIPFRFKIINDFDEFLKAIDGLSISDEENQNIEIAMETVINASM